MSLINKTKQNKINKCSSHLSIIYFGAIVDVTFQCILYLIKLCRKYQNCSHLLTKVLYFMSQVFTKVLHFMSQVFTKVLYFMSQVFTKVLYFMSQVFTTVLYFMSQVFTKVLYSCLKMAVMAELSSRLRRLT